MVFLNFSFTTGRFYGGAVDDTVILANFSDYLLFVNCEAIFFLLTSVSKSNSSENISSDVNAILSFLFGIGSINFLSKFSLQISELLALPFFRFFFRMR